MRPALLGLALTAPAVALAGGEVVGPIESIFKGHELRAKGAAATVCVDPGDVDYKAIERFVLEHQRQINACAEKVRHAGSSVLGKVVVRFELNSNGRAQDIEVEENSFRDSTIANCLSSVVKDWTFPAHPGGPTPIALPFEFPRNTQQAAPGAGPTSVSSLTSTDKELVRKFIHEKRGGMRACLETQRAQAKDAIGGKVVLNFTIDTSGRIANFRASNSFESPTLDACLAKVFKGAVMPVRPSAAAQVSYPIHLCHWGAD